MGRYKAEYTGWGEELAFGDIEPYYTDTFLFEAENDEIAVKIAEDHKMRLANDYEKRFKDKYKMTIFSHISMELSKIVS